MTKQKLFIFVAGSILLCFLHHLVGTADLWAGGIKLRVAAEQANVREKPDITSPILQQLPEGATLEAERKEGEWYAVLVEKDEGGSVLGYVHESLVVVVEALPAEPLQEEQVEAQKPVREPATRKPVEQIKEVPRDLSPPVRPASARAPEEDRPAVTLWLGGRYATIGDLNDGAEGLARYYEARLAAAAEGDVKALHFGYLLGAEARLPLAFGFYFSFGAEYGSGESAGSVVFEDGTQEVTFSTKPRVRAIPISLALVYYPLPVLYLKAGVDYTFAWCGYSYRLSELDPDSMAESWQEWTAEASSSGFGYLAGLGFDWNLTSRLSLTAEMVYRHSRLADFGGEDVYKESSGYEATEKGKLYYIRVDTGTAEVVPLVFVREKRPTEAGVMDVRKAELGLSGFSLKLGIRVRF
ncbi:MAG: SH3 domain-containing protein [Candidatus Aminicenantales bacterium]